MNLFVRAIREYGHARFHEEIVEVGRLFSFMSSSEDVWNFMVENDLLGLYEFAYWAYMVVFYPNG